MQKRVLGMIQFMNYLSYNFTNFERTRIMTPIAIIYFSGTGHAHLMAEAIVEGL